MTFLQTSFVRAQDILKAPPAFDVEGQSAAFIDIKEAHYGLKYDFKTKSVVSKSTLVFEQFQTGLPILNFRGIASGAILDNRTVSLRQIESPAPFVVVDRVLQPGLHSIEIASTRPFDSYNLDMAIQGDPSLYDQFSFDDEQSPRGIYMDSYLPTNLAYDQYPMGFTIDATNAPNNPYLHMNGTIKEILRLPPKFGRRDLESSCVVSL